MPVVKTKLAGIVPAKHIHLLWIEHRSYDGVRHIQTPVKKEEGCVKVEPISNGTLRIWLS